MSQLNVGLPGTLYMPMPKIILFILLVMAGTNLPAQQQLFMYIQANASQPFYARIQNRIYSSSENGYMIVPKLHDSTYEVFIGFAKNAIPEQHFSVGMNKQDQGFELRNFGEKGWGLFNLQNMAVIMNTNASQIAVSENTGERKNDAFSKMLANVVNDSAILYAAARPVPPPVQAGPAFTEPPVEIRKDTAVAIASPPPTPVSTPAQEEKKPLSTDSALITKTEEKQVPVSTLPDKQVVTANPIITVRPDSAAGKKQVVEKPFIARISETNNQSGYRAVYIEQYNFSTDTILIDIPLTDAPLADQARLPAEDRKIPDPTVGKPVILEPTQADTAVKKSPVLITNSDCKNFATDNDVDKLRVKIIAENAIDDKLVAARKVFKTKCFSVKQIRALTELFPSDESKYRFFDTSYPFVSDTSNFAELESLVENDYYKTRFKAMIRR